jgi:hypothetical protein
MSCTKNQMRMGNDRVKKHLQGSGRGLFKGLNAEDTSVYIT